ncbi:MAG: triose-phosphate isomerase [Candidatus Kaiserbacteria bacterium]|nr:triose-phosphate isomerase [Candidatus Kaiserbacteria bacterium]
MKSIVVANWKMNPASFKEAKILFEATKKAMGKSPSVSLIVAPPAIYLRALSANYKGKKISFAVQNAHFESNGARTGEISIAQARDAGADYILIGHSERRAAGETNDDTRQKVSAALALNTIPILCIGEAERASSGEHFNIVAEQLLTGIKDVAPAKISKVIIAYEPVWAIGGEITMSPRDMHTMAIFIRKTIIGVYGDVGHKVKILYGAAVGEKNAAVMMKEGDVRGFIVGHVSTNAERFTALLKIIQNEK